MKIKNIFLILMLFIALMYCVNTIAAVPDNTTDIMSDVESCNEPLSSSNNNADEMNSASNTQETENPNNPQLISAIHDNKESDSEITAKNMEEIQNFIDQADENDTVKLNGIYKQDGTSNINIEKEITIDGLSNTTIISHTLNFEIQSKVTLKNLKFIDSSYTSFSNNVTLINCEFVRLSEDSFYTSFGFTNATVINSSFRNNIGGYTIFKAENLMFINSNLINNSFGSINAKNLSFINVEFTNNNGRILAENLIIRHSNFNNNSNIFQ